VAPYFHFSLCGFAQKGEMSAARRFSTIANDSQPAEQATA
jgi:hypothetical protein